LHCEKIEPFCRRRSVQLLSNRPRKSMRQQAAAQARCRLPTRSGVAAGGMHHRQAVRHEWPILIQAASVAPSWSGTLHPAIIKTGRSLAISGAKSCAANTLTAGARATAAVPATNFLRSNIMPLPLSRPAIDLSIATKAGTLPHGPSALWPQTEARRQLQTRPRPWRSHALAQTLVAWAGSRH
jgi:hypothetical protein